MIFSKNGHLGSSIYIGQPPPSLTDMILTCRRGRKQKSAAIICPSDVETSRRIPTESGNGTRLLVSDSVRKAKVILTDAARAASDASSEALHSASEFAYDLPSFDAVSAVLSCCTSRRDRDTANKMHASVKWERMRGKKPDDVHSHAYAAAARMASTVTVTKAAARMHTKIHAVSGSVREQKQGSSIDRRIFGVEDLRQKYSMRRYRADEIVACVDTDYYLSARDFARYAGNKMMLSTICPQTIAGSHENGFWYIDGDSVFHESITGGAKYEHALWDYSHDTVTICDWYGLRFWVYAVRITYDPYMPQRAIVCLCPQSVTYLPLRLVKWVTTRLRGQEFKTHQLGRLKGIEEGEKVVYGYFQHGGVMMISLRFKVPDGSCVTIPVAAFEALKNSATTNSFVATTVETFLRKCIGSVPNREQILILTAAIRDDVTHIDFVNYSMLRKCDGTVAEEPNPDKAGLTLTAEPLLPPATMPTSDDVNVENAFTQRLTEKVNSVVPTRAIKSFWYSFNAMFNKIDSLCGLVPLDRQEAMERMSTDAAHKARHARVDASGFTEKRDGKIDVFTKAEGVDGAQFKKRGANDGPIPADTITGAPARIIAPVCDNMLVELACFIIPVKDALLQASRDGDLTWFTVGMNPTEIGNAVMVYCMTEQQGVGLTDFSKMDATISDFVRQMYGNFLCDRFPKEHHAVLKSALRKHQHVEMKVPIDRELPKKTIDSGFMNISGSSDTTLLNVYTNAATDFAAGRMEGLTVNQAFARIGPKYGDDGITRANSKGTASADAIGMKLEIEEAPNGAPVKFLSRVYPRADSSPFSICEPDRAISRIPVTTSADPDFGLACKCQGYMVSDPHTPVVSDYVRALFRVKPELNEIACIGGTADEMRRIENGPYPEPRDGDIEAAKLYVAQKLGVENIDAIIDGLSKAKTKEDIRRLRIVDINLPDTDDSLHIVMDKEHARTVRRFEKQVKKPPVSNGAYRKGRQPAPEADAPAERPGDWITMMARRDAAPRQRPENNERRLRNNARSKHAPGKANTTGRSQ